MTAASAPPFQVALAREVPDGQPTAAACAALGFRPAADRDDRGRPRSGYAGLPLQARPAPPPAPPPPPPPLAGNTSVESVVVTAQKRTEATQGAPVAAPSFSGNSTGLMPPPPPADTERYPGAASNPIRRVADEPVSTFSIDVDTAAYANVRRFLNEGTLPPKDAVRVEELVNYFDYNYPLPASRAEPFRPYVAVVPSPWSKDRQILHIGLQGYDLPRSEKPPLNLVFLVDTSGSMQSPDKLDLARKAMNLLIDQLRPRDRVSIVAYAGSAGAVLEPTDGRSKLKMRCALEALQAGGSTAGGQGLALAYALASQNFDAGAVNRVVLLTDGDFNVGVSDPSRLKEFVADKRKTGVYLSVYGFGRGNYNDEMMQALAQNGNGTAAYVDTYEEARKLFRDDFSGSLFPIADDVKIQIEFNPARVSEYRLIGYETRMLAREDFNNDRVDAGEVGSGVSVTALYEITPAGAAPSSDPLRYGAARPAGSPSGEMAFLKVRWKAPGAASSQLMQQAIPAGNTARDLATAPEATRWAVAVAAFGQKLRGDPWLADSYGWDQILDTAQSARGEDEFGLRAEFVKLVRAARDGRRQNE
ncbi:MAG: VWA domain-containing protein [Caulobacterales bacterium]|nr:VWA domain-containing protein [Caulobacterales bacterium]